jgi:hypothetical protein
MSESSELSTGLQDLDMTVRHPFRMYDDISLGFLKPSTFD